MCTLRAWPDRNTAACPAELPPPTSTTSCSAQSRASIGDAQYQTPRPSKSVEVFDLRAPVARAARHHDGARAQRLAAIELQAEGAVAARAQSSALTLDRDHDVGAEFLRLVEGARGQRLAGNAGRKTEIVLDPRAGAGLAAEGARIEHRDREAFGGRIDRGREPGRAAADDRDVVDLVLGRPPIMPSARASSDSLGIAQHGAVDGHDQRPIRRRRRIARDQFGGVVIALGIEQMMRIAVAGEETLQADDAGRIRRPDQHRTADAGLDQTDAAQDQRAHDALAKIGFGDQQRAQPFRRDQQRLDVALGMPVDQRDAAGELADFGEKLAGP